MNPIEYSEIESKRFNYKIYRGMHSTVDIDLFKELIEQEKVDILIVRIPSASFSYIHKLNQIGYEYIIADLLAYYLVDFSYYEPNNIIDNKLNFHPCKTKDSAIVSDLIDVIFKDYSNHYSSNPLFSGNKILEGYKEWATSHIDKNDCIVFLVKKENNTLGFLALSNNGLTCEIKLNGVLPSESGKGIYSNMIRFSQSYFKDIGIRYMRVSTQIQNMAVQKVWCREGFELEKSYITIHINSMLSKYHIEVPV